MEQTQDNLEAASLPDAPQVLSSAAQQFPHDITAPARIVLIRHTPESYVCRVYRADDEDYEGAVISIP